MKYNERLKQFTGRKGMCIPTGSSVYFHLTESHKIGQFIDSIEEVGDDFVVINYASDRDGASQITIPLNLLVVFF